MTQAVSFAPHVARDRVDFERLKDPDLRPA
jgi:hypothetical protein